MIICYSVHAYTTRFELLFNYNKAEGWSPNKTLSFFIEEDEENTTSIVSSTQYVPLYIPSFHTPLGFIFCQS